jgi:hypothetical protein
MRIAKVIVAGSVASAVALAAPALASHSDAQRPAEEAATSSPCQAYEMGADGTWHQQPCQGSRRSVSGAAEIGRA